MGVESFERAVPTNYDVITLVFWRGEGSGFAEGGRCEMSAEGLGLGGWRLASLGRPKSFRFFDTTWAATVCRVSVERYVKGPQGPRHLSGSPSRPAPPPQKAKVASCKICSRGPIPATTLAVKQHQEGPYFTPSYAFLPRMACPDSLGFALLYLHIPTAEAFASDPSV